MWKLFIWGIILGICGLGNFQFSAEFNIYEIENQKIMHRSPLFDFRPVKFSSKLHRKFVQFFLSPKDHHPQHLHKWPSKEQLLFKLRT